MKNKQNSAFLRGTKRPGGLGRRSLKIVLYAAAVLLAGDLFALDRQADLLAQFKAKAIPVEAIEVRGEAVNVRLVYSPSAEKTSAGTEEEMLLLFSQIAESYPETRQVILDLYAGPERISEIEVETAAALSYARGEASAQELLGGARMAAHLDVEKLMQEEIAPRAAAEAPPAKALPEKIVPGSERPAVRESQAGPASGGGGGRPPRPPLSSSLPYLGLLALGLGCGLIAVLLIRRRGGTQRSPEIRARIEVLYQDGGAKSFQIRGIRTTIGRAEDNHLVLHDPGVSSHHAEIAISGDAFILRDLESANGTFLNGERIQEARLYLGDEIVLGATRLTIAE